MDFSKMSNADKIIGVGAIAAVIGCLLPWYSVSAFLVSVSINGLHGWGVLAFIAAILSLVAIALPMMGQKLPQLPVSESALQMILGAVVAGGTLIQILSTGFTGVSIGVFVVIAGGAAIIFGGWQKQGSKAAPTTPTQPTA